MERKTFRIFKCQKPDSSDDQVVEMVSIQPKAMLLFYWSMLSGVTTQMSSSLGTDASMYPSGWKLDSEIPASNGNVTR